MANKASDLREMENRLTALRNGLARAKQERDHKRRTNPSKTIWAAARTDRPLDHRYVDTLLHRAHHHSTGHDQRSTKHGHHASPPPAAAAAAAAAAMPQRWYEPPASHAPLAPRTWHPDDETRPVEERALVGTSSSLAHRSPPNTRRAYEWDPAIALATADDSAYEDLFAPSEPPSASDTGRRAGGGALWGEYDEAASAASFGDAVREWRGSASCGGGGSLLDGTYDEAESAKAFQDALTQWRSGSDGTTALPPPAATIHASSPTRPTLAASMAALTVELGLDADLPLIQLVARANEVVGLKSTGTLRTQVDALVAATGVVVGGARGSNRRPDAGAGVQTQTPSGIRGGAVNYLALLQRDMVRQRIAQAQEAARLRARSAAPCSS